MTNSQRSQLSHSPKGFVTTSAWRESAGSDQSPRCKEGTCRVEDKWLGWEGQVKCVTVWKCKGWGTPLWNPRILYCSIECEVCSQDKHRWRHRGRVSLPPARPIISQYSGFSPNVTVESHFRAVTRSHLLASCSVRHCEPELGIVLRSWESTNIDGRF